MVAITGGLFVSMVVFALAREGSRFYQRENRVAEATLAGLVGFDRLEHDIARAGFLSTPNITADPLYCGNAATLNAAQLKSLASVRIEADTLSATNAVLAAAGRTPQTITLAGAYESVDRYPAWTVTTFPTGYAVRLQTGIGALLRLGLASLPLANQNALLQQLFPAGRALRLLNVDTGMFQVSTITGAAMLNGEAYVYITAQPALNLSGRGRCGLRGTTLVNVINIVRYSLRHVKGNTAEFANYQHLFATGDQPYEDDRLELVREELDTSGNPIANTQELIAEYAVDLQFAVTTVQNLATVPSLATLGFDQPAAVQAIAAAPGTGGGRPQSIRSIRARLSVRSREVDRQENIQPSTSVAPGLYRVRLEDAKTKASGYARVRTFQSDIVLPPQLELRW
jgi:hypothetical protein